MRLWVNQVLNFEINDSLFDESTREFISLTLSIQQIQ